MGVNAEADYDVLDYEDDAVMTTMTMLASENCFCLLFAIKRKFHNKLLLLTWSVKNRKKKPK